MPTPVARLLLVLAAALQVACASSSNAIAPERPSSPPTAETGPDGVVHLNEASRQFVDVEAVGGARSGNDVAAPARVDFRDGAVSQIGTPLNGRVVSVHVQVGDRVRAGDPLVTLDCPDAASTRASVQSATATLREARAALDRQSRMLQEGVGVEREYVAAETRVSELEAELSRQQANAAFVGNGTGTTVVVRSPISGTVISRKASAGLAVQQGGDPMVEVGDPSAVWIVADVFERDLARVREAARVHIQLEAQDGEIEGHVVSIGTVVATGLRSAPVRIAVEGNSKQLRPGAFGRVSIDAAATGLSLPTDAVLIRDGKESVVYVQTAPLVFERRTVVVAQHASDGRIQIVSGLQPGEMVVVRGTLLLDGSADLLL